MAEEYHGYPRRVDGYHGECRASAEQVGFLASLVPRGGRLVEVGTAAGVTAAIVADARPDAAIVCVDTFGGIEFAEVAGRLVDWRKNQRPNMGLWVGDLATLARSFAPASPFDVAFVDADHTYDCTLACLRASLAIVAPGGRIVAHDWGDPNWPEVAPAVDAFLAESGWHVVDSRRFICALASPTAEESRP